MRWLFVVALLSAVCAGEKDKKSEFDRAREKAVKKKRPIIIVATPSKEDPFYLKTSQLLKDKKVKHASSATEKAFLKTECEENDKQHQKLLETLQLSPDDKALLVCDYQLVVVRSFADVPKADDLTAAIKEAKQQCKRKKKVMAKIEKLFRAAKSAFAKSDYKTAGKLCRQIRQMKNDYEKKYPDDELRSDIFDTLKRWAKEVKEKALKILSDSSLQAESGNLGAAVASLKKAEVYKGFDEELDKILEAQRHYIEDLMKGKK